MPTAAPPSSPLTAPAPWPALLEQREEGPRGRDEFPGNNWPQLKTIEYVSKLIMLIVLLLALPWLFGVLLTRPSQLSRRAAEMGPVPSP